MARFGKKSNYTDWLYTRPVLAFLGGLIIFIGVAVFERLGVEREMYERRQAAEMERAAALARMASLEERVEYLEGERGIEEEIRKHFDVAKEGEKVVILTGENGPLEPASTSTTVSEKKWYQFWR